VKEKDWN